MRFLVRLLVLVYLSSAAHAADVTVAAAANFSSALKALTGSFEQRTGHKAVLVFGSTGKIYAQVVNGAPYDVFLAANDEHPAKLEQEGHAVRGSRFTYAQGRLALWSARAGYVDSRGDVLKSGDFTRLAIANPRLAPYGQAAVETLRALGLYDRLSSRLVQGEDVGQTLQLVATGNAPLGFVAFSQIKSLPPERQGSWWVVPSGHHRPVDQQAVLLMRGADNPAARAFLDFLKSPEGRAIVREAGYL